MRNLTLCLATMLAAAAAPAATRQSAQERGEAELAKQLEGLVPGKPQQCVSLSQYRWLEYYRSHGHCLSRDRRRHLRQPSWRRRNAARRRHSRPICVGISALPAGSDQAARSLDANGARFCQSRRVCALYQAGQKGGRLTGKGAAGGSLSVLRVLFHAPFTPDLTLARRCAD